MSSEASEARVCAAPLTSYRLADSVASERYDDGADGVPSLRARRNSSDRQMGEDVDAFVTLTGERRTTALAFVHEGVGRGDSLPDIIRHYFDRIDQGERPGADEYIAMGMPELLQRHSSGFSDGEDPSGDRSGDRPGDPFPPAGQGPKAQGPAGQGPGGQGPAGQGPAGQGPGGQGPAGQGPGGQGPGGQGPGGQGPGGQGEAAAARSDASSLSGEGAGYRAASSLSGEGEGADGRAGAGYRVPGGGVDDEEGAEAIEELNYAARIFADVTDVDEATALEQVRTDNEPQPQP